jgi:hypothetical protein
VVASLATTVSFHPAPHRHSVNHLFIDPISKNRQKRVYARFMNEVLSPAPV